MRLSCKGGVVVSTGSTERLQSIRSTLHIWYKMELGCLAAPHRLKKLNSANYLEVRHVSLLSSRDQSSMSSLIRCSCVQISRVYRLTNRFDQRVYIGVAKDLLARLFQHARSPPSRMRLDAELYAPFLNAFSLKGLAGCTCKADERVLESFYVDRYNATGPAGYNTLPGAPTSSRQYWWLQRRGLLPRN